MKKKTLKLREYQKKALNKVKPLASFGLFMGTGTGKTITSLWRASENPTNKLLIICPFSVIEQWEDTINKHFKQFKVIQFKKSWSTKKRNEHIKKEFKNYNTIIINFEKLYRLTELQNIINENWTIIVDESHRIKNMGSKRKPVRATNTALKLGIKTDYKIILTATPTQGDLGGYVEYYPQLRFLGYIDYSFKEFEDRYIRYNKINFGTSPYPIKVIKNYKNTKEIDDILQTCCVRYNSKFGDYEPQHIKINLKQPSKYAKTLRERVYKDIVMQNGARKRIGMKTLCTGNITGYDYYTKKLTYEDNTIKIDWVKDFLQDTNEVVVIFYQYNVELYALEKLMKKLDKKYITINGKTKNKFAEINYKDYDVMLGQFQAASGSLDGLQHKCNIEVFFSLPESSIYYKQSIGRIDRDGQKKVPTYYYLITENTVEEMIYSMIERKVDFNEKTLNKLLLEESEN